jgi:hypothetical protein
VREEARVNADVHGAHASRCPLTRASLFLTGLVALSRRVGWEARCPCRVKEALVIGDE